MAPPSSSCAIFSANQPKALPSWLNKAEEKFMTFYTQKIIEHIYERNTFFIPTLFRKLISIGDTIQQRLLQHKQHLEQNRHQQQKARRHRLTDCSLNPTLVRHRTRHERKRYRHQPHWFITD